MSPKPETLRASACASLGRGRVWRLVALLFWFALLVGYQLYAWRMGISPLETAQGLV
ncbi:MAG: hypothetical protein H0V83_04925, partial [Rubrobacter sp.]|nr:hypothetical protein [Rubrobacter sp.]